MNPFWSMSTSSVRKRSDGEEKTLTGDVKTSPPRTAPKKQLPSIPKNALPITKPTSPAPATQSTNGTHASYGPFYLEYSLLAEFTLVVKQKLPGVYVQPSYRSALMWFGVIFIRHGLYQDGVFKFTVYIPDNYPDGDCPRLVFDIPVFHPLVDPTSGELDVKRAFAKWRRNHNHIWQVLMYARRVFYKIDTASPLNPEAAVLYEKDIQLFKSKVVDSVKVCTARLFDQPKIEDPYAISFSPWNPSVHDEAREKMLTQKLLTWCIPEAGEHGVEATQAVCSCRNWSHTRAAVLNVPHTGKWCGDSKCFRLKGGKGQYFRSKRLSVTS
uniref:AKT-interacting protein n=1 Tax=Capra hircus TaxID=9925 RepID=A0A8C2Y3P2_CAPHI